MIIAAECLGRESEIAELLGRARAATRPEFIALIGDAGIGKSTVLRRLAQVAGEIDLDTLVMWDGRLAQSDVEGILRSATGPVLLLVDDADQNDELVRDITTLVQSNPEAPVLVVLAAADPTPAISALLADTLRVGGIDRDSVAALATARGRVLHPIVVDRLTRHTEGNPRDAIALLDELPTATWSRVDVELPAPSHVVAEVRRRLADATPPTRALIGAITVLSDVDSLGTAVTLGEIDDPLAAVDEALRTGLVVAQTALTPAQTQPHTAGPLIRAAILEVMGIRAVGDLHRRAATVVADPVRKLHHRVAATAIPDPALADDLDALARDRGSDGAWAEAAGLFAQAGRLTPDPLERETRSTLALDALLAAGDCVGAGALVPQVESLRETPLRNAALAYLAILRGRSAEAQVRLDRAWDIVNFDRDPDTAALIAQRYVLHNLVRCQGTELVEWADRAINMAGSQSPAGVEAAVIRGLGLAWSGRPTEATAEYAALTERIRFGAQAQRATMGRGWLQLGLDDVGAARSNLETAVSMANLGGSARISLWALGWLARTQCLTGDWEPALHTVEQGRALARTSGIALATPLLNWTAAQIHSLRGDWEEAERSVQEASTSVGDYEIMRIPDLLARGQIAEAAADYGKVRRTLEPLMRMADDVPGLSEPGWWPWVDVLANALVIDGQLGAADDLLRPYEELVEQRGHRSASARLKYARGRLLGATGEIHQARRTFEEALEILDGLPLRYDLARVNFAYGQTLRRAGKRRAADAVMGTAREMYLSLGAITYVERCERELKAGGLNAIRSDRDAVDLTPQEEAVTELVSRGMSNREVAAELFISPKTVQYHLTRIYAKLGIRSRSELAALRR
ncbi:LuxR C-terminal-related transcriptional regulator [Gordonia sp. SL306]|uniref:LuxR C-terminal-related transcriptional regulator n=1 Tax=Gordonia sp. SL306 TaxID=2995145 RepID=UPI00226E91D1|nr:LuxR C-terminal-related transcriptional regulator [Gordonia sp. SL306]WAC54389.1 LuxR C-terminal-related transcriptional regulator [Gordonia sp. SL306]